MQQWNNWEQLRCVVRLILIVVLTKVLLRLLECVLPVEKLFRKTLHAQKDFDISRQKRLSIYRTCFFVPNSPCFLWNQTNSFRLMCDRWIHNFGEVQKSLTDVIGDIYCPSRYCPGKTVSISKHVKENDKGCYECPQCKASCHVFFFILCENLKSPMTWFGRDCKHCFAKESSCDYKEDYPSSFLKKIRCRS